MKLEYNSNKEFLNNILKLKLNTPIKHYQNEKHFIVSQRNRLYGIIKVSFLSANELKNELNIDIKNYKYSLFISQIWIDKEVSISKTFDELTQLLLLEKNMKKKVVIISNELKQYFESEELNIIYLESINDFL